MKKSKDAQIVELRQQLDVSLEQVKELQAKLKSSESTKESWYKTINEKQAQLDALHDLLDVLPNPIVRKTGTDDDPDYSRKERSVMERLVAYLVSR